MDPRIAARDLYLEKTNQNAKVQGLFDGMDGFLMKTFSGGIPARTGTSAGKALCQLCMIKSDGTIVETTTQVAVYNPFGSDVAGTAYITVKVINGAQLVVDAEDCPAS